MLCKATDTVSNYSYTDWVLGGTPKVIIYGLGGEDLDKAPGQLTLFGNKMAAMG